MKKLVLVLAVGWSAASAATRVGQSAEGEWYHLETASHGSIARVWLLLERAVPDPAGARSAKVLYEINCPDHTVRATIHDFAQPRGQGRLVNSSTTREWAPIIPGTNPHTLLPVVCR